MRAALAGGLGGVVCAGLIALPMVEALDRLSARRAEHLEALARLNAPAPTGEEALRFQADDAARAREFMAARVRRLAVANDVLVETMRAAPDGGPGIAQIELRLSGREKAVLAVADGIEREGGAVRWRSWRMSAPNEGAARIEGRLAGAWR